MTPQPFHFGRAQRPLYGMLHRSGAGRADAFLVCAPLLQDGIRCQRAAWMLAEALAAGGRDVLRFDWFGSGDSGGEGLDISLEGMQDDLRQAQAALIARAGATRVAVLGIRSGAIPALAAAARGACREVVLLDPQLDGRDLVGSWRAQHEAQLLRAGRYRGRGPAAEADELLGFDIAPSLLDDIAASDVRQAGLPPGARVLQAAWTFSPAMRQFEALQAARGVQATRLQLPPAEQPSWDDMHRFENLVLPRRSVHALARHLLAEAA